MPSFYTQRTMPIDTDVEPSSAALTLPAATPDRSTSDSPLFGAIALAATFGVELMLTAFVAWGKITDRAGENQFTFRARLMFHPERDLRIYVAGIGLTLLLMIVMCWSWLRLARRSSIVSSPATLAGVQVALAIIGLVTFLTLLSQRVPLDENLVRAVPGPGERFLLSLVGLAVIALAVVDFRFQISSRVPTFLAWMGPVLMAVSISEQLMLAPPVLEMGIAIALGLLWHRLRQARREDAPGWKENALQRSAILAAMALASFAVYVTMWPADERTAGESLFADPLSYRTRIPLIAMVLYLLIAAGPRSPRSADRRSKRPRQQRAHILVDLLVLSLLLVTVLIPPSQWKPVSLDFLYTDNGHHWNFFALGPALAFAHGGALIGGIYSQYGVGWPYFFSSVRHLVPISYANALGCSVIYGCAYLLALYTFLRLLLRNSAWAALGVALAASLQIFSGVSDHTILWNFPSSTVLRHPLDIWFFLALLAHGRSTGRLGEKRWFAAAGAICGLALLFELDTGIDLLLILGFYWFLDRLGAFRRGYHFLSKDSLKLSTAIVAAGAMWLVGMCAASRGTVFHAAFWSEYLEGLQNQAFSGLGLLPIADVPGDSMALFAGMLTLYFFSIGLAGVRIWRGTGSEIDLFLASISAYGLGLLLLFVGRSHPLNLYHPMIPLAVVVVLLLSQISAAATQGAPSAAPSDTLPWLLVLASAAFIWSKPEFFDYPSLLTRGISVLSRDKETPEKKESIDGALWQPSDYLNQMAGVARAIKQLQAKEEDVAILDDWDTLLYLLSNRAPWSRYTSLFHCLLTKSLVTQTERELLTRHPRFIVIRSAPAEEWDFDDTWTSFHRFTARHYHLVKTVSGYEFWRIARNN